MNLLTVLDEASLRFIGFSNPALMLVNADDDKVMYVNLTARELLSSDGLNLEGKTTLALNLWRYPEDRLRLVSLVLSGVQVKNHKVELRNLQEELVTILLSIESVSVSGIPCFLFSFESISLDGVPQTLSEVRPDNHLLNTNCVYWRDTPFMLPQNDEYYSDRLSKFVAQEHFITCRLAQALHDQLGQTLTAISLLWGSRQQKCDSVTDGDIDILIRQAINELRDCLMVLRPPFIEEYGLLVALQNEINRQSTLSKCSYISLDANSECTELRWPPDVEFAVFMITREAILNALNHSEAKLIKVSVNGSARRLSVEIEDDGGGFDTQSPIGCAGHLGLVGMTDRAKAINAYLSINSKVTEGTCVQLRWNNSD